MQLLNFPHLIDICQLFLPSNGILTAQFFSSEPRISDNGESGFSELADVLVTRVFGLGESGLETL